MLLGLGPAVDRQVCRCSFLSRDAANISSLSRTFIGRGEPDTWKGGPSVPIRVHGTGHRSDASRDALSVAGVTILLSQTVFSLLVAHVITQTSDAVPLIG